MQEELNCEKSLSSLLKQIKVTFREYLKDDRPSAGRLKQRTQHLVGQLNQQSIESTKLVEQMINPSLHGSIRQYLYDALLRINTPKQLSGKWQEIQCREEEAYCLLTINTQHLIKEVVDHSVRVQHQLNVLKQCLNKVQWSHETGAPECPQNIELAHLIKIYIEDNKVEFDSGINEIFFRVVILEESLRLILQKTYKAIEQIGQNWLKDYTLCPPSRFNSVVSSNFRQTDYIPTEQPKSEHNLRAFLRPNRCSRPLGRIETGYRMQSKKEKKVGRVEKICGCCL